MLDNVQGFCYLLFSALFSFWLKTIKNELKRRQSKWSSVHWELVEPAVSIRTLRARMVSYFCYTISVGSIEKHHIVVCTSV
jgi:hypothetical protein